ncbi:MAG: pilus assembly protein [Alphaproteobacteria bacterium]|nr:pilus assembly protein [Alphaproteobacteria bacterium]
MRQQQALGKILAGLVHRFRASTAGRWNSGATAVEAALVMPLFLLLSFGILEVSLL